MWTEVQRGGSETRSAVKDGVRIKLLCLGVQHCTVKHLPGDLLAKDRVMQLTDQSTSVCFTGACLRSGSAYQLMNYVRERSWLIRDWMFVLRTVQISCILLAQQSAGTAQRVDVYLLAVNTARLKTPTAELPTVALPLFVSLLKASGKLFGLCPLLSGFVF